MKRVVTGVDTEGVDAFTRIDEPDVIHRFGPGFEFHEVWRLDRTPTSPHAGAVPVRHEFAPRQGVIFRVVVIPPDDLVVAAIEEGEPWTSSGSYTSSGEDFGMHRTDTQDLVTVVAGTIDLVLPGGTRERLAPGDVVVQRGTTHAWRNPGPGDAVLHAVQLGTGATETPRLTGTASPASPTTRLRGRGPAAGRPAPDPPTRASPRSRWAWLPR